MDDLDRVITDIRVAARTATVEKRVAHIGKTDAAGRIAVAVQDRELYGLGADPLAEDLIVVLARRGFARGRLRHLSGGNTFPFGVRAISVNGDMVGKRVRIAEYQRPVGPRHHKRMALERVGRDVERAVNAALEFERADERSRSIDLERLAVFRMVRI